MTYDVLGAGALDYLPCRYGTSRLLFRGPRRDLDQPYVAFIGGTETYGKFVQRPFPALVEERLSMPCVNFGFINAGVDVFVHDPFVCKAATGARVTVVQIMGAQNMSNRFYAVHPRRNDRFTGAATLLQTIYREVDFSNFNFTRHMLGHLQSISSERFEVVREELRQAWTARMRTLLSRIGGKVVLLRVKGTEDADTQDRFGPEPLFVTPDMVAEAATHATAVVDVTPSPEALAAGTRGMVFSDLETPAARLVPGPDIHAEVADAVAEAVQALI